MTPKIILIILSSVVFLAGCNNCSNEIGVFDAQISSGQYQQALSYSSAKIKNSKTPSKDDVLWSLQAGTASRLQGLYEQSLTHFSEAESDMKHFNQERDDSLNNLASVTVNDMLMPYYAMNCEAVMVNAYKALNHLEMDNYDGARIEFNRAIERERRAKEYFAKELSQARNEANAASAEARENVQNSQFKDMLYQRYPALKNFEPYSNYSNPFVSYLAGLFFLHNGDADKAEFLIKETVGAVPGNTYVKSDFENLMQGQTYNNQMVWVFFENGLAPYKEEFRIDLPLFLATNKVQYMGIALPMLKYRIAPFSNLCVQAEGQRFHTEHLCDMDKVIETEFNKIYDAIFMRAIISATAKAILQYSLNEQQNGGAVALIAAIYSYATTTADCRIWSSLPKEFQVLRIPAPADRKLTFMPETPYQQEIILPQDNDALVYVRAVSKEAGFKCEVLEFN